MTLPLATPTLLQESTRDEVRSCIFELPGESQRDQPLFRHQSEAMDAIRANDWESGILHLPTGSGKTRIALEYMAERMARDPNERILWASYPTNLIQQAMVRVAEMAGMFEAGTRMIWYDGDWKRNRDLFDRADIVFITRGHLRSLLGDAADGRVTNNALQRVFDERAGEPRLSLSLIYDECHQLGASQLQQNWRAFSERAFDGRPQDSDRFRMLGLSATPLPTDETSHPLLQNQWFPIVDGTESVRPGWEMLVHYTATNEQLVDQQILCPVNPYYQDRGDFDIPESLLEEVSDTAGPGAAPPDDPSPRELDQFARQFNQSAMSADPVLAHLADRLADNLSKLGKTLVFVPTIEAANKLTSELVDREEVGAGRVTLVHSKLDELAGRTDHDIPADPGDQTEAFIDRGKEPCIMVNVGMLTTGFDDPKIRTVVLARLTFSTNLFWQMIGRGTRGLAIDGTRDCFVVDPIRLTQKYRVYEGYRPEITGGYSEYDEKAGDIGEGRLRPDVPANRGGPGSLDPRRHDVDPDLQREAPAWFDNVLEALESFVGFEEFESLLEIDVQPDGTIQRMPDDEPADSRRRIENSMTACNHLIDRAEQLLVERHDDVDLDWLRKDQYMPNQLTDTKVRLFHKRVETVVDNDLTTEEDFERYQLENL